MSEIQNYLQYPFVQYALVVGTCIALSSSLLGVPLVLKQCSNLGNGLSHVAFCATAVASIANLSNDLPFTLIVTIICAVLLLKREDDSKSDVSIIMISVGALAIGYLFLNIFASSANLSGDVCSTLFGSTSILTLSKSDTYFCIALSVVTVIAFLLYYKTIFAVTIDINFAKGIGIKVATYKLFTAIFIAIIIVLAMNFVGSLLITGFIIFPAVSAMKVQVYIRVFILVLIKSSKLVP